MSQYYRILAGGIRHSEQPLNAVALLRETADAMEKQYIAMQEAPDNTIPYKVLHVIVDIRTGESVVYIEVDEA